MSLRDQLGRFFISEKIINDEPEKALAILSLVVPVRVERSWEDHNMIYTGYSPLFRKINEGEIFPWYEVIFDTRDNSVSFRPIEEPPVRYKRYY